MTSVAIGTAIGAAALTVGRGALGAVSNGLSFAAELARATASGPSADHLAIRAPADRAAILQRMEALRQQIVQRLTAARIQLSDPVELISDGQGGIAVAGPHPQQAAIEEILGSDLLLERDFHRLASDYVDCVELSPVGGLPPALTIHVAPSLVRR
jgi:hypothetical protein